MEVEKTLPAETAKPGADNVDGASTDGLAAKVAAGPVSTQPPPAIPPKKHPGGRPPTHGLYTKAAGSDGKTRVKVPVVPGPEPIEIPPGPTPLPEAPPPTPVAPRVVVPPDLLARVVTQALTLTENVLTNSITAKAKAAGLTEADIEPQLEQCVLPETHKELVADLAPYVLEEWGIDAKISPTVCVCLVLCPWAFGAFSAYGALAKLAKEKAAMHKAMQPIALEARAQSALPP